MTLTEFLLARIEETEKRAKMAATSPVTWLHFANEAGGLDWHVGQYMLDVAPARVLAECEAKRRIVAIHGDVDADPLPWCAGCGQAILGSVTPVACDTLRAIALPYADHPDYREEWKL